MFERYAEVARRVIVSSKHKASHVGSPDIETEHVVKGGVKLDHWGGGKVDQYTG